MKIVSLQSENIKKLVAVEIKPDGNIVEITGKNGQGKTSILDSIWWALAGSAEIQDQPIRKGETKAKIRLDLGEIVVTRTFTAQEDGDFTTAIHVENAEGARYQSPQAMLDKLVGSLTFDPLAFARMPAKDQFQTLTALVPGIDFGAIDRANKADFEARADLNRSAKAAKTNADAITLDIEGSVEGIDVTALVAKLGDAGRFNADIETRRQRRIDAELAVKKSRTDALKTEDNLEELVDLLEAEIEERKSKITAARENAAKIQAAFEKAAVDMEAKLASAEPLPSPVDAAALEAEIAEANKVNDEVRSRSQKIKLVAEHTALQVTAEALTATMEKRTADKQAAIAAAAMPAPGIGFGDGFVTLAGVPFEQASDAEQLRASISIAMALNPKLRVIRVRDGSLLDEDSMKILGEMATAADFQCWVERVDSSGKVGFVIENGKVKGQDENVSSASAE